MRPLSFGSPCPCRLGCIYDAVHEISGQFSLRNSAAAICRYGTLSGGPCRKDSDNTAHVHRCVSFLHRRKVVWNVHREIHSCVGPVSLLDIGTVTLLVFLSTDFGLLRPCGCFRTFVPDTKILASSYSFSRSCNHELSAQGFLSKTVSRRHFQVRVFGRPFPSVCRWLVVILMRRGDGNELETG